MIFRTISRLSLLLALCLTMPVSLPGQEMPHNNVRTIAAVQAGHPRLLFLLQDEERLRLQQSDPYLESMMELLLREANANLEDSLIVHKKNGKRLLRQCRLSLGRITTLSMAFRLTGDVRYLQRAEKEMLAAAALPDWNPSHFLDVAEMATGLAIGYDWLYGHLSEPSRVIIRRALVEKALEPGFSQKHWWEEAKSNWNQVCNTGLALAALAIAEDEPEWAERAIIRARANIVHAMKASYEPMGVYPEGPGYWDYGTTYNVILIAALESALGSDFGLSGQQGFEETAFYRLLVVGPDGEFFKYSDCGEKPEISPSLYWFARKFNRPDIAWLARAQEGKIAGALSSSKPPRPGRFLALSLVWYTAGSSPHDPPPLDYFGNATNPIALFRSSWSDDALWLAFKGGNNQNSHNHMDAGQFVILAGGIRWSEDLGADDYYVLEQLPGNLWGEGRYDFFRTGIQSHSTLIINGDQQEIESSAAPIIKFYSSATRSHAVADLSRPWRMQAGGVLRGVAMLNKKTFLVQDEISDAKGEILWQMMTVDKIVLRKNTAVLKRNGQKFVARIISPRDARFEQQDARPFYRQEKQNKGFAKLLIRLKNPHSKEIIAVQMGLQDEMPDAGAPIIPLSQWNSQFE